MCAGIVEMTTSKLSRIADSSRSGQRPKWLLGLGLGFGIIAIIPFVLYCGGGDTAEISANLVQQTWAYAIPAAASALLFALWLAHPWQRSVRLPFAIAVAVCAWAFAHQRLIYNLEGPNSRKGQAQKAEVRECFKELEKSLTKYKADNGYFPASSSGLFDLIRHPANAPGWKGPYLNGGKIPKDPWGSDFIYQCPGTHNSSGYDLSAVAPYGKTYCNWADPGNDRKY